MTPRRKVGIGVGAVLALALLVWAAWPSEKSAVKVMTQADPLVKTSELNRVEAKVRRLGGLESRVKTLESRPVSKPSPVGANTSAVRELGRKVEKLNGEIGDFGRRILDLEEKSSRSSGQPTTEEAIEVEPNEAPISDAEAERRFVEKLKAGQR